MQQPMTRVSTGIQNGWALQQASERRSTAFYNELLHS